MKTGLLVVLALTIPLAAQVNSTPVINDTSPLPSGALAVAYSYQFSATGGTQPYIWSPLTVLPPGLGLSTGGLLSGTPTQTGLFTINIQVADNTGTTASKTFSLVVATLPIEVTTLRPPPASTVGVPYPPPAPSAQPPYFQASQGTGVYTWTGDLAPGLNVSPASGSTTGIAGTPTVAGTFPSGMTVTDTVNRSNTVNFTLTINPAPAIVTNPLSACTAGTSCTRTLSATGGTQPFTWSMAGGSLPPGMSLSTAGTISGSPGAVSKPATYTFSVRATDSATASDTQPFSLMVNPAIGIAPSSLPETTS